MEDDYESVLWVGKEAYVYKVRSILLLQGSFEAELTRLPCKIPPRQSTSGYKAAEWGNVDECFLWKGGLFCG